MGAEIRNVVRKSDGRGSVRQTSQNSRRRRVDTRAHLLSSNETPVRKGNDCKSQLGSLKELARTGSFPISVIVKKAVGGSDFSDVNLL